jgi:hypothetical protein
MIDDAQAIKNLVHSYCELLDLGDIAGLERLFERCSVVVPGMPEPLVGAESIQRLVVESVQLYDGIPSTKHFVGNIILDIADDRSTAWCRSYYVALQARPGLPLQPIISGRWHDVFTRDEGQWWFAERAIHADLMGDISAHIARR